MLIGRIEILTNLKPIMCTTSDSAWIWGTCVSAVERLGGNECLLETVSVTMNYVYLRKRKKV